MKNVRWIVQDNLISENDRGQIKSACESLGVDYEAIIVIPFSDSLPDFTVDDKVNIYYGSTTLINNIYKQFNKPVGVFYDEETFSMENYLSQWGDKMLNSDARVITFDELVLESHEDDSLWFIRPDKDDKSFDGQMMTFAKIKEWSKNFMVYDNVTLTGQTKVLVGPTYNIKKEWRNYIVDGKVVESTLYRENFMLKKSNKDIPADMIQFVEECCSKYMPYNSFAMDIAFCGDTYYIIECGCINSVGFYAANIQKIIKALTESVNV